MKKNFFLSLIISLIIGSCTQDKESIAKLKELNAIMEIETRNKAIVQKLIDGLNNRDTMMYKEVYAPNCALYLPSSSTKSVSRSEDLQARFTSTGTQKEEWNGIPASGKKFEIGGIFIVRIKNGKVIEQREDADLLGLFQQLGMELKME
jgi:hypothetical protein